MVALPKLPSYYNPIGCRNSSFSSHQGQVINRHSLCGPHLRADFSKVAGVLRVEHIHVFRDAGEQRGQDIPKALVRHGDGWDKAHAWL